MYTTSRRRRHQPYTHHGPRGSNTSTSHHRHAFENRLGNFTHFGWMSVHEMSSSMAKLGLTGTALLYTKRPRLHHLAEKECQFILLHGHWVLLLCLHSTLIFFDPAGRGSKYYIEGNNRHVHDVGVTVQAQDSVMCGNNCLFAAYAILCRMPDTTKHTLMTSIHAFLARLLTFSPGPLHVNDMVLTVFTYDHKLGEEFESHDRYPQFEAYRRHMARVSH